jgi:hypothetical protein
MVPRSCEQLPPSFECCTKEDCRIGREAACTSCKQIIPRGVTRLVFKTGQGSSVKNQHWHEACYAASKTNSNINAENVQHIEDENGNRSRSQTLAPEKGSVSAYLLHHDLSLGTSSSRDPSPPPIPGPRNREAFPRLILPRYNSDEQNTKKLWEIRKLLLQSFLLSKDPGVFWLFVFLPGLVMVDTYSLRQNVRNREVRRRLDMLSSNIEYAYQLVEKAAVPTELRSSSHIAEDNNRFKKVERLVVAGELSKAAKLLTQTPGIVVDEAAVQQLRDLHLNDELPEVRVESSNGRDAIVNAGHVKKAIAKLPRLSGCGCSGDTIDLWKAAVSMEGFLEMFTDLIGLIADGLVPDAIFDILGTTRMIPIPKKDKKLRPIAIGESIRRICSATLLIVCESDIPAAVGQFQYGVGKKSGAFSAIFSVQSLLSLDQDLFSTDISNAFGSGFRDSMIYAVRARLPRLSAYAERLYNRKTVHLVAKSTGGKPAVIECSRGVDQGDPASPLIFAMLMADIIDKVLVNYDVTDRDSLAAAIIAYLDDVILNFTVVPGCFEHFVTACSEKGLKVNASKCGFLTATGSVLGGPAQYGNALDFSKAEAFFESLTLALRNGLSKHCAWLLGNICGSGLVNFTLTFSMETNDRIQYLNDFYRKLIGVIIGFEIDDMTWKRATLPTRLGGLGIPDFYESNSLLKLGATQRVRSDVENVVGRDWSEIDCAWVREIKEISSRFSSLGYISEVKNGMSDERQSLISSKIAKSKFNQMLVSLSPEDKAHLSSLASPETVYWLNNNDRLVPDEVFALALKLRLRLPVADVGVCKLTSLNGAVCNAWVDCNADHTMRCLKAGWATKLHNRLRDTLASLAVKENYLTSIEENVGTDGEQAVMDIVLRSEDRPPIFLDISVSHPVTGEARSLVTRGNIGGSAAARREYEKHRRYRSVGGLFVPFCLETTGRCGREAKLFLERLYPHSSSKRILAIAQLQSEMLSSTWARISTSNSIRRRCMSTLTSSVMSDFNRTSIVINSVS